MSDPLLHQLQQHLARETLTKQCTRCDYFIQLLAMALDDRKSLEFRHAALEGLQGEYKTAYKRAVALGQIAPDGTIPWVDNGDAPTNVRTLVHRRDPAPRRSECYCEYCYPDEGA